MRVPHALIIMATMFAPLSLGAQTPVEEKRQRPLSISLQAGPSIPTGSFSESEARSGLGYGVEAAAYPTSFLALYVGYGATTAESGQPMTSGMFVELSGFELGARAIALAPASARPWVGAGLSYR